MVVALAFTHTNVLGKLLGYSLVTAFPSRTGQIAKMHTFLLLRNDWFKRHRSHGLLWIWLLTALAWARTCMCVCVGGCLFFLLTIRWKVQDYTSSYFDGIHCVEGYRTIAWICARVCLFVSVFVFIHYNVPLFSFVSSMYQSVTRRRALSFIIAFRSGFFS